MLNTFQIHHFGTIIKEDSINEIEGKLKKKFVYDPIQKTRVIFSYDEYLNHYIEYIVKEGRVAKSKLGFAHICYSVIEKQYNNFNESIKKNKNGFPLTKLEKSITEECNLVRFYFIDGFGLIELNLKD